MEEYISASAAIHELRRFIGIQEEMDRTDTVAFTNDALDRIMTAQQYEHKICLLPVENYRVELPDDLASIGQVAYRETCDTTSKTRIEISELTQNILGSDCDLKIQLECPKCHEFKCNCKTAVVTVQADRLFQMNNPQYYHNYMNHFYSYGTMNGEKVSPYHGSFKLIRKTTSSFFNVPYHISECVNFNLDCNIEYSINYPNLIINVKSGEILLSYFAKRVDEEGYRMMPNDPTVIRAVAYCLAERYLYKEYIRTMEQNRRIAWQMHVELSEKWVARARAKLRTPSFDEAHSFITGFIHRMVPKYKYWEDAFRRRGDEFKYPGETRNIKGYDL